VVIQYIMRFALLILLAITGCVSEVPKDNASIGEKNFALINNFNSKGQAVQSSFSQPPQRVIAVWQNSVETLLALGVGDKIIAALGVPYPECLKEAYRHAYRNIPVRQLQLMDTENMLMLRPDFILAWSSTFTDKYTRTTDFWNGRGINTYMARSSMRSNVARKIEDEYQYIYDIGRIFGKEQRALELIEQMNKKIEYVQENTRGKVKPRALIMEIMKDNVMVYGKNTLAADILERVRGELVDTGRTISYEQIIDEDPEVIFFVVSEHHYASAQNRMKAFMEKPSMKSVSAVRNRRVYIVPLFMVYNSATRTYDGICLMSRGLYPELQEEAPDIEKN